MKGLISYDDGDISPITFSFVLDFLFGYNTSLDFLFIMCF